MMMQMRAISEASRAIAYTTAASYDLAHKASDVEQRQQQQRRVELMTPVVKGWCTEMAQEATYLGIQVHGGMGFIEETGAAQHYRDARIATIYEGTNGIQCIDLVRRKLPMNGGETVRAFLGTLNEIIGQVKASNEPALGATAEALGDGLADLTETTAWLGGKLMDNPEAALAGATHYGRLFSLVTGGALLARGALSAIREGGGAYEGQILLARHFAETQVPATAGLKPAICRSHDTVHAKAADTLFE